MNRRSAFKSLALYAAGISLPKYLFSAGRPYFPIPLTDKSGGFSMDGNKIRFTHPGIANPFSVTMIADTHLFRDDDRGQAFSSYSNRMSKAYNHTKHYLTGKDIHPEIGFEETLQIAKEQKSALIALIGDIFSFPSEAAIEWVLDKLHETNLPYVYTAGNHDWHYEGMEGTSASLRETWIKKRLSALYQGRDPMMQKIELNGVNLIVLDNSTYEINEAQLDFLKNCLSEQKPALLMLHIPLYAPGRNVLFGCGHPEWGSQSDKGYVLERRLPWRANGHTKTTMEFYKTVVASDKLMGVLAGHIHNQSIDIINGIPQIVTESNAEAGYLQISFVPSS